MTTSPLAQLRALEKQKLRLLEDAKAELLQKIDKDLEQLRGLGFDYALLRRGQRRTKRKAKTKANGSRSQANPCAICGFATDKPHDARSHRWQKPKAPFTTKELEQRGMTKA